jgi:hypothetical protein
MKQDDIDNVFEDLEPTGTEVYSQDLPEDDGIESPAEDESPAQNLVDKSDVEASKSSLRASLELSRKLDKIKAYLENVTTESNSIMNNCNNIDRDFEKILKRDEFTGDLTQIMARTDHQTLIRRMSEYISMLKSGFTGSKGELKQVRSSVHVTDQWINLISEIISTLEEEE